MSSNDIKKQILLDLFITPSTVIPFLVGGTLLMLSAMLGGYAAFLGFVGLLISFGALLTNWIFNLDRISRRAVNRLHKSEKMKREAELDALDAKLVTNKDPRDQTALRNLRVLYNSFSDDLKEGKITNAVPPNLVQLIEEIFGECVTNLSRSWDIWKTSRDLQGDLKNELLNQRERLIDEVENSVRILADTINEVRALKLKTNAGEMQRLRQKLVSQLQVAKATEESVASLDAELNGERYEEYAE